jgi:hypothetical protein
MRTRIRQFIATVFSFIACCNSSGQIRVDFPDFEGYGSAGKVAVLYSGTLPSGAWKISELVQDGTPQDLGGFNPSEAIIDNALVLEANGQRYGLNHRYDGIGIYGGVPYTNQPIYGHIEISVWETHDGSATAAASGTIRLISANPQLQAEVDGNEIVFNWPVGANNYRLQFTRNLAYESWTTITDEPSIIGEQCVCTIQINGSQCFFRLMMQ